MNSISYISFKTKYGWLSLYGTSAGLKEVRFGKHKGKNFCITKSNRDNESTLQLLTKIKSDILKYLSGGNVSFSYPLDADFTEFQRKLFSALKKYAPYGKLISYKELASKISTFPRACGQALGANPLPIIIPCHRVIRDSGDLGGFNGGLRWKKALIKLECGKF